MVLWVFFGPFDFVGIGAADGNDLGPWDTVQQGVDVALALVAMSVQDLMYVICKDWTHHAAEANDSNLKRLHNGCSGKQRSELPCFCRLCFLGEEELNKIDSRGKMLAFMFEQNED